MSRATTTDAAAPALADLGAITAFLVREAQLLDERRFEEWRELFDEDGYYWVPLRPGQTNPEDEVSLFFDDRDTMEVRFQRLRHPRIHADDPPSRSCRIVGSVRIESVDGDGPACTVFSNLIMADYRQGEQRVFAGRVSHRLRHDGGGYRIAWKKVELINCDDVLGVVTVPF